jgi:hypothetical protein
VQLRKLLCFRENDGRLIDKKNRSNTFLNLLGTGSRIFAESYNTVPSGLSLIKIIQLLFSTADP